jgi:peptidoglycan DL-endopeptidase CwlO
MGSHRARHRVDQNNSEELATDLLARLADEVRAPSARTRHVAERPGLDPFSTAPFPARTPRTAEDTAAAAQPERTPPGAAGRNPAGPPTTQPGGPQPAAPALPHQQGGPRPGSTGSYPAQPGGAHPEGTWPGTAEPDAAQPGGAHPEGTWPGTAGPDAAQPGGAHPDGTQPGTAAVPRQRGGARAGRGAKRRQAERPDAPEGGGPAPQAADQRAMTLHSGPAADQRALGLHSGPAAELSAGYGYGPEPATHVPAPRFPSDPAAPFPLEDAPAGLMDAPRTGRDRLAALGRKPIYAAVSATMITAAVAATAGPAVVTPPPPSPDRSPSLAAAALDLAPPAPQPGAPAAVQVQGGPAVLTPDKPGTSDGAPVLGSNIAAQAAADAKAYAEAQARQAAGRPANAPRNAPAPKPAPKPAVKQAPKPAAAPATGSSVGARALALAKGKLGTPYVWGAAGPSAFDCSGLIVWAYKQIGVSLPHSSATLSTMGTPVSKAALQPGDLVFFYSPVSHVGIYAGNGMVLNATQSGEPVQFSKLANLPFHNAMRLTK